MEYPTEIYQTESGHRPFSEWLNLIKDKKTEATLRIRIKRLEQGNFGNCEPVGEGISELKIYLGPGYRIYFGKIGKKCVLLLCGGHKGKQTQDIAKAKEYFEDFKSRGKNYG